MRTAPLKQGFKVNASNHNTLMKKKSGSGVFWSTNRREFSRESDASNCTGAGIFIDRSAHARHVNLHTAHAEIDYENPH